MNHISPSPRHDSDGVCPSPALPASPSSTHLDCTSTMQGTDRSCAAHIQLCRTYTTAMGHRYECL